MTKKKLIEVALPLDVINIASEKDKRPESGAYHPKGFHHWWARLPLPSARAILFASLVDDPSSNPDKFPTEAGQETERERLFELIRKLCQKKIHTHQQVFEEAHREILKHCDDSRFKTLAAGNNATSRCGIGPVSAGRVCGRPVAGVPGRRQCR